MSWPEPVAQTPANSENVGQKSRGNHASYSSRVVNGPGFVEMYPLARPRGCWQSEHNLNLWATRLH